MAANRNMLPTFGSGDEVIVLDAKDGVIDTTRRPLTGARLKAAQEQIAREAELRQLVRHITGSDPKPESQTSAPDDTTALKFDAAMMDIYRRAKSEANYSANRYFQMLTDHGGLETARILLHSTTVSEGYAALWERGRLDLTVEALIYEHPEYYPLFTDDERRIAIRRLVEYKYPPILNDLK